MVSALSVRVIVGNGGDGVVFLLVNRIRHPRNSGCVKVIVPVTVREILYEQIAMKL